MHRTKVGIRVHNIRGIEYVTEGQRVNNMTTQRHYQVEYPQNLQ